MPETPIPRSLTVGEVELLVEVEGEVMPVATARGRIDSDNIIYLRHTETPFGIKIPRLVGTFQEVYRTVKEFLREQHPERKYKIKLEISGYSKRQYTKG